MEANQLIMALLALGTKCVAFAAFFSLRLLVALLLLVFGEVEPRLELFGLLWRLPNDPHLALGVDGPPDVDWADVVLGWWSGFLGLVSPLWRTKDDLGGLKGLLDAKFLPFLHRASVTTAGGCLTCDGAGLVPEMLVCLPCGAWVHVDCIHGLEISHGWCTECAQCSLVTGEWTETKVQRDIRKRKERALRKKENKRENRAQGRHQKEERAPKQPRGGGGGGWGAPLGIRHPHQQDLKKNFFYPLGAD
ncbi:hypothetical protein H2204_004658 [Knufia peltigerae]|uniref:Uncharacterized protein n=1 Tax=Knufia peltigerae TaxID=1002370 RepID=A0AA38Y6Q4_9EURO|nr:hypothetical protein H2204_004658 [Knufia peltigerae]